jgi:transcriptional regulator with XRE-family HTH domain
MARTKLAKKTNVTPDQLARFGHIAAFLREEMAKREWSSARFNEALGLSPNSTTVYTWLRGSGAPNPEMRAKLAALFAVHESTFMGREIAGPVKASAAPVVTTPVQHRPGAAQDVLSFSVDANGQARLRLDATLPLAVAAPLLRMLLDAGIVFGQEDAPAG